MAAGVPLKNTSCLSRICAWLMMKCLTRFGNYLKLTKWSKKAGARRTHLSARDLLAARFR
jgi:hypothetical protein